MAKKLMYFCDRCGTEYEEKSCSQAGKTAMRKVQILVNYASGGEELSDDYDLCPYCSKELFNWLADKPKRLEASKT